MKKEMTLLVLLLMISSVSAISTTLNAEYEQQETMIIEVTGNLLSAIQKEKVGFLRGHVEVPFNYDVIKIGGRSYIWAIAPANEEDYALRIKDVSTTENGKNVELDYHQNFSIGNSTAPQTIEPGFVQTDDDFSIVMTLNRDTFEDISISLPEETTTTLSPGKNTITFARRDFSETGIFEMIIGDYTIPLEIRGEQGGNIGGGGNGGVIIVDSPTELDIYPRAVTGTLLLSALPNIIIELTNIGPVPIITIGIEHNDTLITTELLGELPLPKGETIGLALHLTTNATTTEQPLIQELIIKADNTLYKLPINLAFTEEETEVDFPDNTDQAPSCNAQGGRICAGTESCTGDTIQSREDAICCTSTCTKPEEPISRRNVIIGWVIALFVLIGIIFIIKRYKNAKAHGGMKHRMKKAKQELPSNTPANHQP